MSHREGRADEKSRGQLWGGAGLGVRSWPKTALEHQLDPGTHGSGQRCRGDAEMISSESGALPSLSSMLNTGGMAVRPVSRLQSQIKTSHAAA